MYPLENYATFDRVRKMRWDNEAILNAISYHQMVSGHEITYDDILDGLNHNDMACVIALIYGALCSADKNMSFTKFGNVYRNEYLTEYLDAVNEGINHYLPDPTIDDDLEDLDESYPDTQAEIKKKTPQPEKTTGANGHGLQKKGSESTSRSSKKPRKGQS